MKIIVLMSTYNGEKYLREQIDSILNQTVECSLLVRDDGSTDGTLEILKNYESKAQLNWYQGKNLGPCSSFFDLIKQAEKADYYALSDQDDYWKSNKLETAINKLDKVNSPCLYFSKRTIVDEELTEINMTNTYVRILEPGSSLIEGIAYGCTMVFDFKVKMLISELNQKYKNYMHDAFIYRLVSLTGKVIYDDTSYIKYRQHSNNVVGHEKMGINRWIQRFKNLPKRKNSTTRSDCAKELWNNYQHIVKPQYKRLLYAISTVPENISSRFYLIFSKNLKTQHRLNVYFLKIFIFLGWL